MAIEFVIRTADPQELLAAILAAQEQRLAKLKAEGFRFVGASQKVQARRDGELAEAQNVVDFLRAVRIEEPAKDFGGNNRG